jgi:hypothetical protein
MLCNLYQEQQNWSTTKCANEIVHLLHILYAFWPQLEVIIIEYCYSFFHLIVHRHVIILSLLVLVVVHLNVLCLILFFIKLMINVVKMLHF